MSSTIDAPPSTTTATTTTTSSSPPSIIVLADDKDVLGEGPLHDPRTRKLYRVDIEGKKVLAIDVSNLDSLSALPSASPSVPSASPSVVVAETPEAVGCAALTSDPGKLLVALSRSVHVVDVSSSSFDATPLATLGEGEGVEEGMRFNDGKVSPQGTFIIGRMHSKWREGKKGAVYALVKKAGEGGAGGGEGEGDSSSSPSSSSWSLEKVLQPEEVGMGNGMAWLKVKDQAQDDEEKWYFFIVDSAAKTVQRFSCDPQTGIPLSGTGRVVLDSSDFDDNVPDGMDVDGGGNLWVALAETGTVACLDPLAKEKGLPISRRATLRLPLTRVTSCAFGGAGRGGGGSGSASGNDDDDGDGGGDKKNDLSSALFVTSREEASKLGEASSSPVAGAVLFIPDVAAAARIGGVGGDEEKRTIRGGCSAGFVKL